MKIQHWAIIFIFLVIPMSIVCRNMIDKKVLNLRDETRYNNIIDNATYDAVSQIIEVSEELGYGKNIPITEGVAMAAIDRFFNTLSVNFNLPMDSKISKDYFSQYIPAIVIVGYDGLYVYSIEDTSTGYEFKLKPKIPYTTTLKTGNSYVVVNFTLDNYVSIYCPNDIFLSGLMDGDGNPSDTHVLSGYVGQIFDYNGDGIDDRKDSDPTNDDPFGVMSQLSYNRDEYVKGTLPMLTDNLSYILSVWNSVGNGGFNNPAQYLDLFYVDNANEDYKYNDVSEIINEDTVSEFHKLRRDTIINLITNVLTEEFNEHNDYANIVGATYHFFLPDIGRDEWNNTIDDISVLSFFQGMPMGADSFYNNYSLGGSRIVQANYFYAETVIVPDIDSQPHKVYHKYYCSCIPRDSDGNIVYSSDSGTVNWTPPNGSHSRISSGIENIFVNESHAKAEHYYACSECM